MKRVVNIFSAPFKLLAYGLIYFYKYCISPLFPQNCRFLPTCSTYALQAIKEFGLIKGSWLSFKRILRCNPKSKCGLDPVPTNIKGEIKWLI